MSILASDLVFFGSAFPHDTPFGGGRRLGSSVQSGTENNLFPDVPAAFRKVGGMQLRKFYPSVISDNAEALMQAQVLISAPPADPGVESVLFPYGTEKSTQADVLKSVTAYESTAVGLKVSGVTLATEPGTNNYRRLTIEAAASTVEVGRSYELHYRGYTGAGSGGSFFTQRITVSSRDANPTPSGTYIFHTSDGLLGTYDTPLEIRFLTSAEPVLTMCGASQVSAISSSGATVTRFRVIPPGGKVGLPIFRTGDAVLVAEGSASEVVRLGMVVDAQLTFATPLVGSYTTAALVSSPISLGDLQAVAGPSFSQQTWTRVYADAPLSAAISANYDRGYAIAVTNKGAITDRWAFIFTGATTFKCIGEQAGAVGAGSTTSVFAPLNPLTGVPYFSIPVAGWGDGWAIGNVWRFDTVGAYAPVWEMRRVVPSSPAGVTSSTKQMRGSVNA